MIFSFGARRSGTWWLQRIITTHPRIAPVPSESFFFSSAIAPLFERFQHEDPDAMSTGRIYAERELLLDATRDFCDRIFRQFATGAADHVAERTPWHVLHLDLMTALYPDAYYIHIFRDGRDAARSLASMDWYDGSLEDAATEWRDSVMAPRSSRRPQRYTEIQYERLASDPQPLIAKLFEFLELDADDATVGAAVAEAGVELSTDPRTRVGTEKWRRHLSPEQQATVTAVAGEALAAYGYRTDDGPAEPTGSERRGGLLRRMRRQSG
jgi:hypothetical protein